MHDRHFLNQDLGFLLLDQLHVDVLACPFYLQSGNLPAVIGFAGDLACIHFLGHFGVDGEFVQLQPVFFALLLAQGHEVGVGNVDATQPGHGRLALDPLVLLVDAPLQRHHPAREFLVGLRGQCLPLDGDEPVLHIVLHRLQVHRHADDSVDRVEQILQIALYLFYQKVDTFNFLFQDDRCELEPRILVVFNRVIYHVFHLILFIRILQFVVNVY